MPHAALALLPRDVIRQPMAPAAGGPALISIFVLLAGCGVRSSLAQICNAKDPESGGIVVPAFGTGGAKVCLKDANDTLGLAYVNADGSVCERAENDPQWFAILYFVLLLWTFAGVGIIADVFMDAISVITSVGKWVSVRDPETGQQKQIRSM